MTEIDYPPEAEKVVAKYISLFGDVCRKCKCRWELELIHHHPLTSLEEAGPDEVMIVCSSCKEKINERLKERRKEDLSYGSRKFMAAWNAEPTRWPMDHPVRETIVPARFFESDGLLKKAPPARKTSKPRPKKGLMAKVKQR